MRLASLIVNSFRRHQDIRGVCGETSFISRLDCPNTEGAPLSWAIFVDGLRKLGSKSPKETQQKALCCIISKGLKFGREGILFSSELHNGAFTEPLLKGIATAFVLKGVSFGRVC